MILKIIAFLLVILVAAYLISRWRLKTRLAAQSEIAHTSFGPVEYIDQGEGPVVVHMHGMLGGFDHCQWCEFLVKAGFRVITPSRPGYLRTPLASGKTPLEQAALLAALLDTLGIKRVALYAYSQGGAASLEFIKSYPDRCWGIILFSSLIRPQPDLVKMQPYLRVMMSLDFILWLVQPLMLSFLMKEARKALPGEVEQDENKLKGIREIFAGAFQAGLRGRGLQNDFANSIDWRGVELKTISTPTLILHGDKDAFIKFEDSQWAAGQIQGSSFIPLEGAGHEALVTCIDQIKGPVLDFLNANLPADDSAGATSLAQ